VSAYDPSTRDPTAVLGRRVVAFLIDIAIPTALFVALFLALATTYDKHGGSTFDITGLNVCDVIKARTNASICFETTNTAVALTQGRALLAFTLPLVLAFVDFVVLQGATGASIGKHILGLRVVDTDGREAGLGRAFVRWILLPVDMLCGILGLVVASLTHPHRRVGDMAAGTYVVGSADTERPIENPHTAPVYDPLVSAYAPPASTETQAVTGAQSSASAPVWDAQRGAWLSYDPAQRSWLRYDDATRTWVPL
jgi:uncharacterized RDD family membrane protein YckC